MKKQEYRERARKKQQKNERIMGIVGIAVAIAAAVAAVVIVAVAVVRNAQPAPAERLIGSWTDKEGLLRYSFDGSVLRTESPVGGASKVRSYRYTVTDDPPVICLMMNDGSVFRLACSFDGDRLTVTSDDGQSKTFVRDRT